MNQSHHEDDEQAAVFEWAAFIPELKWLHAIPNGGNRAPREAARLKRQGVKKGVSDLFLPLPAGEYHGCYIEMKRSPKQGRARASSDQMEFIADVRKAGYFATVCFGADQAIDELKRYIQIFRAGIR